MLKSGSAGDEPSPFVQAIRCASATMKNKIIGSEDDLIGILLYNTVTFHEAVNICANLL